MTIEDMKILVQKHIDAEMKQNVEGVLATLVENPVYEVCPAGLRECHINVFCSILY